MIREDILVAETELAQGTFTLRAVDPADDAELIHAWMNDPEVARYWVRAQPLERVAAYLRQQVASAHSTPFVGCLDGTPMSYWEVYRADLDPLAHHYAARPRDAGVHLLLGPAECRGRGLGSVLLRAVSNWLLRSDPYAGRVVAEPDIRNVRSVRAFESAGFRMIRQLDLPDKRAAFMVRERLA
ncbi:acetyltransferase [Streptomyces sp. LP05-1]|uniref:Lysine N-acyltransferase MbtK n=1 Tax=Streptomyces pyxinae TaxID=2970734 RepID=A0ABT2CDC3_9ACTN|nr:GNAT family N-acetyltransferase [Streptomyces sp. LP05-1]MCS0635397.1 acetyltransferase [Streptomyces sp. LP05-1]